MSGAILRKYGVAATINFRLFEVDGVDFRVDAVHAAGDSAIMKDEGAEASTSNSFTDEGNGYSIVLTATEMEAARIVLYLVDQTATKVWLDTSLTIETYGNASAQHAFDLDTASVAQSADNDTKISLIKTKTDFLPSATAGDAGGLFIAGVNAATTITGSLTTTFTGNLTGSVASVTGAVIVGTINANVITAASIAASALDGKGNWNIGKTGYSISGTITTLDGLKNFDPAVDVVARVTLVDTTTVNTDMRGTNNAFLAASAPANFSSLVISVAGIVDANAQQINSVDVIGAGIAANLWRA